MHRVAAEALPGSVLRDVGGSGPGSIRLGSLPAGTTQVHLRPVCTGGGPLTVGRPARRTLIQGTCRGPARDADQGFTYTFPVAGWSGSRIELVVDPGTVWRLAVSAS